MDTVLGGRWKVFYEAENRQKRIVRDTAVSPTIIDTVKDLYLALADLFHSATQMDDGTPMSAQTPTEYTIGIIDSGDDDSWFIDKTSMQWLKGGALKTALWKRTTDVNTGIIKVTCINTNIVAADIGYDISGATTGNGTLLHILNTGGANTELWIRPDSSAAGDDFTTDTQVITCNAHTAEQAGAASFTGEMLWANVYNTGIASLSVGTHQFAYQGVKTGDSAPDVRIEKYETSGEDWWGDGTFDVLILVADQADNLVDRQYFIDKGYVSFFARQYSETYSFYIVDLFAGGRNPIPMETGNDLNNPTGHKGVTTGVHTGTFVVGEEFNDDATGNERGIITAVVVDTSIDYYPIGDPQNTFDGSEAVEGETSGATCTLTGPPNNIGPAAMSGLSVSYGSENTHDIDNDGTNEYYSIDIDVSDETLVDAYEWAKYIMRNGNQGTGDTDGIEAEQFIGIDYIIDDYNVLTGSLSNGDVVTQANTGATGTVVAHHTTPKIITLRNCRGTFNSTDTIADNGNNVTLDGGSSVYSVSPIKACPWGIFAGGTWFLAQGCVLTNRQAGDANSYQVIDDEGNLNKEPTQVTVYIGNTRIGDWITLLRLVSGVAEKDYYDLDTITAIGDTTLSVDPAIRTGAGGDDVGEPSAGRLSVITSGKEYVYRYTSYTGDDFTLFALAQKTCDAGGTATELNDVSEDFVADGVKVGDIVRNDTLTEYVYVTKVETTKLTTTPLSGGTWDADLYTVGAIVAIHAVDDYMYVFLMHIFETTGTDGSPGDEQVGLIYEGDESALLRARHANDTQYLIKPFSLPVTIGSSGLTQNVIRTEETITS